MDPNRTCNNRGGGIVIDKCRRCSECRNSDHHWVIAFVVPDDDLHDGDTQPDLEIGQPYWQCKHCQAITTEDPDGEDDVLDPFIWDTLTDDNGNDYLEADSPHQHDGVAFRWRLRQRLAGNCIQWYGDHDAELLGLADGPFDSMAQATEAVETAHYEALQHMQLEGK